MAKGNPPKKNGDKEEEGQSKEVDWRTHEEHPDITGIGDSYDPGPDQPK